MKNRKPKYTYASDANGNIYAISTYAGKTVRGVAKYNPNDKFDEQIGMELAAARCNQKVAKKRYARAIKKMNEAQMQLILAQDYLTKMENYLVASEDAYNNALLETAELEAKLQ